MLNILSGIRSTAGMISLMALLVYTPARSQETAEEELPADEPVEELLEPAQPVSFEIPPVEISEEFIIDQMNCLQKDIKLTYNDRVKSFIDYFTIKNRRYLEVMESRRNVYFPVFEECLKKYGMPDELKYLSIVESGLNPKAISPAGAGGLWQFMPSTGKIYGLHQDFYLDERMDPYEATEAACKYLKQLYNMFDDWELALASYNCGPGNVRRAIRRSGYKENFWSIYRYLPRETRGYVPQFVAITYAMNFLQDYNFTLDSLEYAMEFDTIHISNTISLDEFCENLHLCKEDLIKLNPGLKREILPGYLNYALRIPSDLMEPLQRNRMAILDSSAISEAERIAYEEKIKPPRIYYRVRRGDYLGKIASRYHVSVSDLKRWNSIRGTTIHSGQKLVIYRKRQTIAPSSYAKSSAKPESEKPEKAHEKTTPKTTVHVVRTGENLYVIASKYGVTVTDLKKWNQIHGSVIKSGQKLTVYGDSEAKVVNREVKVYYVQPGDTLWSISKKYHGISVEKIKKRNNLKDENIKPGMKLIIG